MDLKLLRHLLRLMERGELSELKIDDQKAGLSIHLKRGLPPGPAAGPPVVMMSSAAAPAALASMPNLAAVPGAEAADEVIDPNLFQLKSPMVGTFYRASSPEAEPFATEGAQVGDEDVVCVIEAMKVMNEIQAECKGEIVQILVENGDPVEFGQPLFLVKTR
ncbi:MAG: acetyl-CoA carboxylase biotin carboxyl carrier protein [Chlamydiales bacterium]|jgi:acetyl-CoA carboxylase biotin carboxyl carrier protein